MSDKKTNDIIEEQRKARQEFINLKKMQKGEMYAGPKPSETATVLKTPKDKFGNFWHYSKWYVISISAIIALIVFLVAQCASKTNYDLKLVYFTYTPVIDDQTELIEDYIEKYADDINENGSVDVQVINCSVSGDSGNYTMRTATLQKLQSIIVAEDSALLFITDEDSIEYFDGMNTESSQMFLSENIVLDKDFYSATEHKTFGKLPEGLTLACRNISGTVMEDNKNIGKYFEASKKIIEKIKAEQKEN